MGSLLSMLLLRCVSDKTITIANTWANIKAAQAIKEAEKELKKR